MTDHDKHYSINCSKIEKQTRWHTKYKFDDALKQTVNWYLQNQSWWEPLINENTLCSPGPFPGNELNTKQHFRCK